eukprot:1600878-Pleurochrysis_carterae.AAC.4
MAVRSGPAGQALGIEHAVDALRQGRFCHLVVRFALRPAQTGATLLDRIPHCIGDELVLGVYSHAEMDDTCQIEPHPSRVYWITTRGQCTPALTYALECHGSGHRRGFKVEASMALIDGLKDKESLKRLILFCMRTCAALSGRSSCA